MKKKHVAECYGGVLFGTSALFTIIYFNVYAGLIVAITSSVVIAYQLYTYDKHGVLYGKSTHSKIMRFIWGLNTSSSLMLLAMYTPFSFHHWSTETALSYVERKMNISKHILWRGWLKFRIFIVSALILSTYIKLSQKNAPPTPKFRCINKITLVYKRPHCRTAIKQYHTTQK
jgi:hypothetical protein